MRRLAKVATIGAGIGLAVAVAARDTAAGRLLRNGVDRLEARARFAAGRLRGLSYRLAGRTPDPSVPDDVLADRIRSELGPLEKRLDVPHVHVTVESHVAILHGEVASVADRETIERAVLEIAGVCGVDSHLHVGLGRGTTRPSEGRAQAADTPSPALRELLAAARAAGASDAGARAAVRAVLVTFAARVPGDERAQLLGQLPADVRDLATPPASVADAPTHVRTITELVDAVRATEPMREDRARAVTESVLGHLRGLVQPEVEDVAAVLPEELRELWTAAVPG